MNSPQELAQLVLSGQLLVATALWLTPLSTLGQIQDEAARLNLEAVDLRQQLLIGLPEGTKFSGLSAERVLQLVKDVARKSANQPGALVYNLDLLLARLNSAEMELAWQDLFSALPHHPRGIILTLPETAINLLPGENQLQQWRSQGRFYATPKSQ